MGTRPIPASRRCRHCLGPTWGKGYKTAAPPGVEWCNLPESNVFVSKRLQVRATICRRGLEGAIDTSDV